MAARSCRRALSGLLAAVWLTPAVLAHGGSYRGPYYPGGPGTPGPNTGVPGLLGAPPVAPTTATGSTDQTRWQVWWEFNKDAFLEVKGAVVAARGGAGHPTLPQIDGQVVPALSATLRATRQPDLASACLVALGKVAPEGTASPVGDLFRAALRDGTQETRETAALAFGITRGAWAIDDLTALVLDDRAGRRLVGRERVEQRTRTFAAYGLGLIGERAADLALRARIVSTLRATLQRATGKDLDLALACVHGLRLACPALEVRTLASWQLTQEVLDTLWSYALRRAGQSEQVVQAHAMAAAARILDGDDTGMAARYLPALVRELGERGGRHSAMAQCAAQALGYLARPSDEEACQALRRLALDGNDKQARAFATIALGQIGGDENRAFLLRLLTQGHKVTVKPWAALALGVLRHRARREGSAQSAEDRTVGRALQEALNTVKAADPRGAFAIALGLAGHQEAAGELRALLAENERQDEFAGYLAVGLGLLRDQTAVAQLRAVAKGALRRPQLLRQIAVALGVLGDGGASDHLLGLLRARDLNTATLGAVAGALAQVGNADSLAALTALVRDDELPDLARAFAAAAVGGIADDDLLPWNASLSIGVNYRSVLPTLTDGLTGILDIL